MTNLYAKYEDWVKGILGYWADKLFFSQGPCDFDLKINRGHRLIMTNLHAKYEDCGLKNL
jgi:hypothetical protein